MPPRSSEPNALPHPLHDVVQSNSADDDDDRMSVDGQAEERHMAAQVMDEDDVRFLAEMPFPAPWPESQHDGLSMMDVDEAPVNPEPRTDGLGSSAVINPAPLIAVPDDKLEHAEGRLRRGLKLGSITRPVLQKMCLMRGLPIVNDDGKAATKNILSKSLEEWVSWPTQSIIMSLVDLTSVLISAGRPRRSRREKGS